MSPQPKVLYLDQNAWIALARGAWDKTAHPCEHAALTVVIEALEAGRIVVPLSFTNQCETMKVDIPVRRVKRNYPAWRPLVIPPALGSGPINFLVERCLD